MPVVEIGAVQSLVGELGRVSAERTRLLAAKMKAYQPSFVPSENSVIADFNGNEATYDGYAAATIVWMAAGVDADGGYSAIGTGGFFQATGATTPNLIGGVWLETAGGDLVEYWPFPAPVVMSSALDSFLATPIIRQPQPDELVLES